MTAKNILEGLKKSVTQKNKFTTVAWMNNTSKTQLDISCEGRMYILGGKIAQEPK
jgi:hypothetical protein